MRTGRGALASFTVDQHDATRHARGCDLEPGVLRCQSHGHPPTPVGLMGTAGAVAGGRKHASRATKDPCDVVRFGAPGSRAIIAFETCRRTVNSGSIPDALPHGHLR